MTATAPARAADPTHWDTTGLDLDAYLRRIGHVGPVRADLDTFITLHRHHVATFPFENLDVMLGRGTATRLTAIQAKLVGQQRGGYCYEQNLLFAAALERVGFAVRRQLIRTDDPLVNPRPRGHLCVLVDIAGERWFGDVGFGSGLLEPIPLAHRGPVTQGGWTFRLTGPGPDGGQRMQEQQAADGWRTLYTITDEATYPVDVDIANENTSTSPGSPFVRQPIMVHRRPDLELRLLGRTFMVVRPDGSHTRRTVADRDWGRLVRDQFGLALPPADVATLLAPAHPAHNTASASSKTASARRVTHS